jgi:hypothetical protein
VLRDYGGTSDAAGASLRRWRVTASLSVPLGMETVEPPDPGELLPKKLRPTSRIESQRALIGTIPVRFSPSSIQAPEAMMGPQRESAELDLEVEARNPTEALEGVGTLLELLLDRLAFEFQEPLFVLSLRLLDITPPLRLGEDREFVVWPGYPLDPFSPGGRQRPDRVPAKAASC